LTTFDVRAGTDVLQHSVRDRCGCMKAERLFEQAQVDQSGVRNIYAKRRPRHSGNCNRLADFDFIWIDFEVVVSRGIQNVQQEMLFVGSLPKRSELYFVSDEIMKLGDIKVDGSELGDGVKRRT
jgi:hypothetical protein